MTESLRLPLRLPKSTSRDHDSLEFRINQINTQKGAFRNVTEASLVEEIKRQTDPDEDIKMVDPEESDAEKPEDRYQMIIKSREDMIQQLRYVLN